ncbi:MAG: alpha/beta hydrolase, partial [Lachnospiraceae bacterium]
MLKWKTDRTSRYAYEEQFYYLSKDQRTNIHAVEWEPKGKVKAVLQLCHGMAEYIDRYDEFASFLMEKGYLVVGHDHLGHGQSVQSEAYYGFFEETKGNELVIGDIRELYLRT